MERSLQLLCRVLAAFIGTEQESGRDVCHEVTYSNR